MQLESDAMMLTGKCGPHLSKAVPCTSTPSFSVAVACTSVGSSPSYTYCTQHTKGLSCSPSQHEWVGCSCLREMREILSGILTEFQQPKAWRRPSSKTHRQETLTRRPSLGLAASGVHAVHLKGNRERSCGYDCCGASPG